MRDKKEEKMEHCSSCGRELSKKDTVCKYCNTPVPDRKQKTDILGNCALIFAFFIPIVGLVLGILSVVFAPRRGDGTLFLDGIKAIVISVVVTVVKILFWYVLGMLGVAVPFIIMTLA